MSRLRVAVIGVGHHGRNHARIFSRLDSVELAYVVDVNRRRAEEVAQATGSKPATDAAAIVDAVDAVSVAVPTESHLAVARLFLERGLPVLVEKPLARSVSEAEALVSAARASGAVLAVGHTERFNPAVAAARPLIRDPKFIEVHRLGTFPERSLDIDVVFDLMIHDLDLIRSLVGAEVERVDAVGVPVLTGRIDIANVRLRFASGCIANVTASRISKDRVRKIRLFQKDAYLSLDYALQEVEVWRLVRPAHGMPTIDGGRLEVAREEPLGLQLADFVAAIRERRAPAVTGEDGLRSLALAERVVQEMSS